MNWLTPEQAVARAQLSLSPSTLASYPNRFQQKITTEERFQKLGLLFDRDRYEAGKPYLALLKEEPEIAEKAEPTTNDKSTEPSSPDANSNINCSNNSNGTLCEISKDDDSSLTPDSKETEPYVFEKCTVKLTITFLPDDNSPLGREVILTASSHGDFPANKILRLQELGELPPPVTDLLNELKADFPNRKIRRIFAEAKTKKKAKEHRPHSIQSTTNPTTQSVEKHQHQNSQQLTLSFL